MIPKNNFDDSYNRLLQLVLEEGVRKETRNGATLSVFGAQEKFDLTQGFPLLTTKQMAWKSIVTELLWFLSGSSNVRPLMLAGNKIWDANAYDFYLKKRVHNPPLPFDIWKTVIIEGCHDNYPPLGEMGAVYGAQWRHWRGEFNLKKGPVSGIDQIAVAIQQLRNDPNARDIIVTAWDPVDANRNEVALPPCHILFQFYTRPITADEALKYQNAGHSSPPALFLDCQMYQRSCDLFLGVPFNIASYALLVHLVARTVNMAPGVFTHTFGDLHIYENHLAQVQEQLRRGPFPPPQVNVTPRPTIDHYTPGDILLLDYQHHPAIKAEMSV